MIRLFLIAALVLAFSPASRADVESDEVGLSLSLPRAADDHWVWLNEPIFRHAMLFDGDSGRVLGMVDAAGSLTGRHPLISRERGETYVLETFYARGNRGQRRDFVTIYDSRTLDVVGEVEIPARTADVGHGLNLGAVLDGGRFLVVFNHEPANSVSVIDLESRTFAAEITTAGCALIYPVGPRRFGMLCGNGTALTVELDEGGGKSQLVSSEPFFSSVDDPLTEKGVRDGNRWLFASFEGYLHEIDFSAERPTLAARWSLFSDSQRADSWRIGGQQHLALHRPSRRLFSTVHQGEKGTHKEAGSEIWVYDLKTRERVQVIEPPSLMAAFLIPQMGIEKDSFTASLMEMVIPSPGVDSVVTTRDDAPLLFVRHRETGAAGVYDALTGDFLRYLDETGLGGALMVVP
jgi:methylamine dehydrogenase heavy chain